MRLHLLRSSFAALFVALGVSTPILSAQVLRPPVASIKPKIDTLHGEVRTDNYFWIREKTNPDVIAYLNAENAYTAAKMRHTEALQSKLYDEMLSRIKENDVSVPYRENGYLYWNATEKGKSYPIRMRRKAVSGARDEVLMDENALAEGRKFSQLGDWAVSPGTTKFAYLHDTTALRVYTLYIKDLGTGKLLADSISRVVPSIAWANDTVLFYQTADSARRADAVWRHVLGTPQSSDVQVFHESDVLDNVGVNRSKSGKFIMIYDDGFTSSEARVIPTASPFGAAVVVAPRRANVEYSLEHIDGSFLMTTNDGAQNFKVMRIPDNQVGTGQWTEFIPSSDSVFIENLEPFRNNLVVIQRSGGLRRLRVMDLKTRRAPFYITFPESAYAVSPNGNIEFDSDTLRFTYQSMVTPPTTYDYAMSTRERVVKKKLDVPGFDSSKYEVKRFMVKARDGAMVPVSMIVGKSWKQDGTHPLLEYAYGSYGSTTEAGFNSSVLSLVDRGFAYAIAHIRGAGIVRVRQEAAQSAGRATRLALAIPRQGFALGIHDPGPLLFGIFERVVRRHLLRPEFL
ncbi:MAG TPA: hypothetical protein VLJ83_09790, partial [Gemmatimonadaceae bacterium]|nr:hypothetical protein [Gemmatimonadaceae bacterium]